MHHAAEKGRLDFIKFLVDKAAQMDIQDNEGSFDIQCCTLNARRSTPNAQRPMPNAQRPTERPTPNAQRPAPDSEISVLNSQRSMHQHFILTPNTPDYSLTLYTRRSTLHY
jgi:hypothetical protein